jgi:hypothetical protein
MSAIYDYMALAVFAISTWSLASGNIERFNCGDCDSNFMSVISRRCTKLGLMHKKPDAAPSKNN